MNKKIIPYITTYLILLLVVCGLLVAYPKAELHLMLNGWHTGVGDSFFKYYTQLAEWPLYVVALIPLCFHQWRWTVFYAISECVAALLIFFIKRIFSMPRPVAYFQEIHNNSLPLVKGVTMHHSNSFPSGHSSTFFLFFTFSALLLCHYYKRNKETLRPVMRSTTIQQSTLIGLLFLALLGCYSRVYLSQHFLSDIAVGSVIGVIVACGMFFCFSKIIMLKKDRQ